MEFSNSSPKWFSLMKTGVPVKFSWNQGSFSNTWVGYVSYITKTVAGQISDVMEVHCVGSTFPLKERVSKVFTNKTIPSVVQDIVSDFGFNFVGEDNGVVFEQLTIAGHSYWEWIQEQARRIGYGVLVDNMNFYFRPIDKLIDQSISSVPVLNTPGNQMGINNQVLDRTLDKFKVMNGEYMEDPLALRTFKTVSGVDPITSKMLTATSSPKEVGDNLRSEVSDVWFSEIRSDRVTNSTSTTEALSDGAAHLARLNMPATIACQGDPRIRPFAPVLVQDTGPLTDGYWICREVKHMFARIGDYQIEMKVSVDGTGIGLRTVARQGTTDVVGMVNLSEALKGNGVTSVTGKTSQTKLVMSTSLQKEDGQGFSRTPSRWSYVSNGGN
jgi:phage protein D